MVPTAGTLLQSYFSYYSQRPNGPGGYGQLQGYTAHFIPVKSKGVLFGTLRGGTSLGAENLGLAGFSIGGPLRLSAYDRNELLGSNYFLAQTGFLYRLIRLNPLIADAIYADGVYEIGEMYNGNAGTPSLPMDFAGAVIVKTLIGPLYGGASVGNHDHRKWFIGLGRVF